MSHLTPLEVRFQSLDSLKAGLAAMGIRFQEANDEPLILFNKHWENRGYKSGPKPVQLLVDKSQIHEFCNTDIGFQWDAVAQAYAPIADAMELATWVRRDDNIDGTPFARQLAEQYARAEITREFGVNLTAVHRQVLADGTIQIRLQEAAGFSLVEEEQLQVLSVWS